MKVTRMVALATAGVLLAACGGGSDGEATGADGGSSVTIASGDLWFDPEEASADAGEIEFTLDNSEGAVEHDLVLEEAGDLEVAYAEAGETVTGSAELEAGTYTYYCSVPGHRSTMEGTLEVS